MFHRFCIVLVDVSSPPCFQPQRHISQAPSGTRNGLRQQDRRIGKERSWSLFGDNFRVSAKGGGLFESHPPPLQKERTKGKESLWLLEAPVRKMILQMHTPVRTSQCGSRQTPAWTQSVHLDAPGQRHGQQPVSGTADPRSSQTGQLSHLGAPLTQPKHVRAHRGSE